MDCLLCGTSENRIFNHMESMGFPLTYYQCQQCGLIFQNPEESRAADPDFYARIYRELYQASEDPTAKDLTIQQQRAAQLLNVVHPMIVHDPQRVLDIGASTGVLLKAFEHAFGSKGIGVEPGEAYRVYAERQGLEMFSSLEALIETQAKKFDLVSVIHVLEHLPTPLETLRLIRKKLLAEDGMLLLEVPNFYAHDSYELAHLICFTPHTFQEVLRQAGFEIISLSKSGMPRSALLNLYLTIVASPLPEDDSVVPIRPDRFVRFKRRVGFLYRRMAQKLFPHKAWLPLPDERGS